MRLLKAVERGPIGRDLKASCEKAWNNACKQFQAALEAAEKRIEVLKGIGQKYSKATEYHDKLMENKFIKMPFLTQKFVNQIGKEILQALGKAGEVNGTDKRAL